MPDAQIAIRSSPRGRRVLLVATTDVVPAGIAGRLEAGVGPVVHVVAPMLHSPLRFYTNDDRARRQAQARLATWLAAFRTNGIEAGGEVGDDDPVQSIEDGIALFGPEEIIVVTSPDADAAWLERGAVGVARTRVSLPLRHLVATAGGTSEVSGGEASGHESDHGTRELLLLIVTGLLAMMGSGFWFLGGSVLPTDELVLYAIFVDIVPKVVFIYLVWRFWLGRGHERR